MNKVTLRAPAQQVLDELGVPHKEAVEGLYVGPCRVNDAIHRQEAVVLVHLLHAVVCWRNSSVSPGGRSEPSLCPAHS